MAHYAFLDENNVVTQVIPGVKEDELIEGLDPETWYGNLKGQVCKRTSYNTVHNVHLLGGEPFRKNYAGIGYTYDEHWDAFIPPKPFPSWVLNYSKFDWEAPKPKPEDTDEYYWKWGELAQDWIKITI